MSEESTEESVETEVAEAELAEADGVERSPERDLFSVSGRRK